MRRDAVGSGDAVVSGRYKGASTKGAPDVGDMEKLATMYRDLQRMGAAINMQHPCQHPIAAARATVFAAWAEISGEAFAWSLPAQQMLPNGLSRRSLSKTPTGQG